MKVAPSSIMAKIIFSLLMFSALIMVCTHIWYIVDTKSTPAPTPSPLAEAMERLKNNPDDPESVIAASLANIEIKNWLMSEKLLSKLLEKKPDYEAAIFLLGVTQRRLNKSNEAAKNFERLLNKEFNPKVAYNLAIIYKYDLNIEKKASMLLKKILDDSKASSDLKQKVKKELSSLSD